MGFGKYYSVNGFNGSHSASARASIRAFQLLLVKHGFAGKVANPNAWADGIYGAQTAAAVVAFKKKYKMLPPVGVVGGRAWNAIFKNLS